MAPEPHTHTHPPPFFKLSALAALCSPDHPQTFLSVFTLRTLRAFEVILPAQQMSAHSNLDAGSVYLWQADATVLIQERAIFISACKQAKAFRTSRHYRVFCSFSLLLRQKEPLAPSRNSAGSVPGEMQCQKTPAFQWCSYEKYVFLITAGKAGQTAQVVHFTALESSKGRQDPLLILKC